MGKQMVRCTSGFSMKQKQKKCNSCNLRVLYGFVSFFVSLAIVLHGMCKPAFDMKTSRLP